MRRRRLWSWLLSLGIVLALAGTAATQSKQARSVDLLLRGGLVVDGSGATPRVADVGIQGDRIVFVGNAAKARVTAARTIDVKGLVVAPGFIDPHTHVGGDLSDPARNANLCYLMQGVTTVVVGNDGAGPIKVAETLERWEKQGIGTNAALYVGHGTVRGEVLGPGDVQPTPEQMEQMKALVRQAMQEGALGFSTGLFYVPGSFAKTEEVIELSRVAGEMGGIYDSHMRDEDSYSIGVLGSIQETIRIGREAHIPVHIAHIKALGPAVWGKSVEAIEMIRKARAEGVDVTADQYPYVASGSNLIASLLPAWAQAGRRTEVLARLTDPVNRARLLEEMAENLKRRGGADSLLFTSQRATELVGRRLAEVAKERKQDPVEAALGIITEYLQKEAAGGSLAVASFNMSEQDIERFMQQDWVMTGSDGSRGHPRLFGTFPKKLREYVYTKKLITLPFAVHQSSVRTAETLHLRDRGLLKPGYFADVIAFDPATIADRSTYEDPEVLAVGMKYVVVSGKLAVENGEYTKVLAGKPLRRNQ
jgi:N-acyl-D-amino-acid deacylase